MLPDDFFHNSIAWPQVNPIFKQFPYQMVIFVFLLLPSFLKEKCKLYILSMLRFLILGVDDFLHRVVQFLNGFKKYTQALSDSAYKAILQQTYNNLSRFGVNIYR